MLLDRRAHLEAKAKGESSMSVRRLEAAKSFSRGLVEIRMTQSRRTHCPRVPDESCVSMAYLSRDQPRH